MTYTDDTPAGYNSSYSRPRPNQDTYERDEVMNELFKMAQERIASKKEKELEQNYGEKPRTWQYYEDLRKKDKAKYQSPSVQSQMLKDATELGDNFHDAGFDTSLGRAT